MRTPGFEIPGQTLFVRTRLLGVPHLVMQLILWPRGCSVPWRPLLRFLFSDLIRA